MSCRTQRLNLIQIISLVTGNLVGSGVFLLPATLAKYGLISLLGWVITSIGATFLALVFARLSLYAKVNGGPHNFVAKAFGFEAAFWVAWGYWILSCISNAALVVGALSYLSPMINLSNEYTLLFEIIIVVAITTINIFGVRLAGRCEVIFTFLKLLPLLVIPIVGIYFIDWSNLRDATIIGNDINGWQALKYTFFLTIWGFIGLETATVPSNEVENLNNIPKATILGTSIAASIYILGTVVLLGVLGQNTLVGASAPYAELAGAIFGGEWTLVIALAAAISCLGSYNGWTLIVGRIAQGAAETGLFPKFFARKNHYGTPYISILVSASLILPLLYIASSKSMLDQFNSIIDFSISLILIVYLVCVLSYFKILSEQKRLRLHSALIGGVSLVFVLTAIWASGLKMVIMSCSILLLGFLMRPWITLKHLEAAS